MRIDAHHHLWDMNAVHYPWLMERGIERLFGDPKSVQRDYLVEDFRAGAACPLRFLLLNFLECACYQGAGLHRI